MNYEYRNGFSLRYTLATLIIVSLFVLSPTALHAADANNETAGADQTNPDTMAAGADTAVAPLTKKQKADLNLQLEKVHLYSETGKSDEAENLLDELKTKYPNDPQVLAAEADLNEQGTESPGTILSELCDAKDLDPSNANILQRGPTTPLVAKGTFACGGYNRRITNEAFEQLIGATAQTSLAPDLSVAVDLQNDHLNTRVPFLRTNGTEQSFYGDRQQATVTLDKMFGTTNELGGSVFALEDNAGAGLQYRHWDRWGSTAIMGNLNKPNWDYVEMVVQNGTEDSIVVERQQIITQDLGVTLDGSIKRYSLDHDYNTADAPGWEFGLDYEHDFNFSDDKRDSDADITLGAHYDVDAEYFTRIENRFSTATSESFNPLPATSYEIHSFTLSAGKAFFADKVKVAGFGGYGVNRLAGNSGPLYGGSITYNILKNLGIDIHGSRTLLGGQNESEKEDILGASLKVMW